MPTRILGPVALVLLLLVPARAHAAPGALWRNAEDVSIVPAIWQDVAPRGELAWRPFYWGLFRDAAFGRARTERAAWIVWQDAQTVRLERWPHTAIDHGETWRGLVNGALAILHTHPTDVDPRPSQADLALARRLHLPVYSIGRDGIFRGEPDGRIVKVGGEGWFGSCTWADGCPPEPPAIDLAGVEGSPTFPGPIPSI